MPGGAGGGSQLEVGQLSSDVLSLGGVGVLCVTGVPVVFGVTGEVCVTGVFGVLGVLSNV